MKRRILLTILVALIAACQSESTPSGTAITNVTIIDAINGVRENQTVVYDGDAITRDQRHLFDDSFTVDGRPVGAAKIP